MAEHDTRGAQAPGLAAPEAVTQMDEAPGRTGREGFRGQGKADSSDCPAAAPGEQAGALITSHNLAGEPRRPEKLRADVFARAALIGVAVVELADGTDLAAGRGWLRPCADLEAVQHLVRQLTPGGAA